MYTCARTVYAWAKAVTNFWLNLPAAVIHFIWRTTSRVLEVCAPSHLLLASAFRASTAVVQFCLCLVPDSSTMLH